MELCQLQIQQPQKYFCKNSAPFIDCISEVNKSQRDNAKDTDVVMVMYYLMQNIVIITKTHQEVYGNTIEMNQL